MPQEQTEHTMLPDSDLKDGKVRPKSKVKVLFLNSVHHNVPFTMEEVHPALAAKLIESGKAEKWKGKLIEEQTKANEDALLNRAKSKGRKGTTAAKAKASLDTGSPDDEFDDEEDLTGDKGGDKSKAGGAKK